MISLKFRTLLLASLMFLPQTSILFDDNLVASELDLDNLSDKSADIIDCNYVDATAKKDLFNSQLKAEITSVTKVCLEENLEAPHDKWFEEALSQKGNKFTQSVGNLLSLIIDAKDVAHETEEEKKEHYNNYVSAFLNDIKNIYFKNATNISSEFRSKIMGLINGLNAYKTLWWCFHKDKDKKHFNLGDSSVGLEKAEIENLCQQILLELKNTLSGEDFTVDGVSLWDKLCGNTKLGKDDLFEMLKNDWYCYLVGTSVISLRNTGGMCCWTPVVSDVNTSHQALIDTIRRTRKSVQELLPKCKAISSDKDFIKTINADKDFDLYLFENNKVLTARIKGLKSECPETYRYLKVPDILSKNLFDIKSRDDQFVNDDLYFSYIKSYAEVKSFALEYNIDFAEMMQNWSDIISNNRYLYMKYITDRYRRIDLAYIIKKFKEFEMYDDYNFVVEKDSIKKLLSFISNLATREEKLVNEEMIYLTIRKFLLQQS